MKIYKIKKDDFERVAFATLKKVFSPTLYPKVLTNIGDAEFLKMFDKMAKIDVFLPKNVQNFAQKVHFGNYDIGLYFSKRKNIFLKIYDGNGLLAGSFVTNIFDDFLFCDDKKFLQKKCQLKRQYKNLNKQKLLIE